MNANIISREAAEKTKGFRLQKIRAIKLMLDAIQQREHAIFYAAIEVLEDVSITISDQEGTSSLLEEDKNYKESKNFTLFSDQVKNTLVSFFDVFNGHWKSSEGTILGFYTTAGIGKERKKEHDDGTEVKLPPSPILEILRDKLPLAKDTLDTIRHTLLEEYEKQYKERATKGNLETLRNLKDDELRYFLGHIEWQFDQENEVDLKATVITAIKDSRLYSLRLANKEELIFSLLMEKLDERQNLPDLAQRFVYISDIKLIFKEAESEECQDSLDPAWVLLKTQEAAITDKRNLGEKILAACPSYPVAKVSQLARIASLSKAEEAAGNKSFKSLKYRVFEACEEYFSSMELKDLPITSEAIDEIVESICVIATEDIGELKKDYTYTISNKKTIKGVVLNLFDGCFVSFDKGAENE